MPESGATVRTADSNAVQPAVLVGRQPEFDSLDASFKKAVEGARQIVLIAGEAGLGKTTLVENWLLRLASKDEGSGQLVVCRGRCLQQFGSGEPYLPVFEALERLSRSIGPRLLGILRTHAPTWLLHMPSLISLQDRVKLRDEVFGTSRR
jgi:predicted ATPase